MTRSSDGKFRAGSPGRPRGSKNRISNEALAAVRSLKDEAFLRLQEKLTAGDWNAIVFVMERILPRGRTIELPDASPSEIKAAMIEGQITTAEARDIATALEKLSNVEDLEAIKAKLAELEAFVRNEK